MYGFKMKFNKNSFIGLWVHFLVLLGHIPTKNLGKLPPPPLFDGTVLMRQLLQDPAPTKYIWIPNENLPFGPLP